MRVLQTRMLKAALSYKPTSLSVVVGLFLASSGCMSALSLAAGAASSGSSSSDSSSSESSSDGPYKGAKQITVEDDEIQYYGLTQENCSNWDPDKVVFTLAKSVELLAASDLNLSISSGYQKATFLWRLKDNVVTPEEAQAVKQNAALLTTAISAVEDDLKVLLDCGSGTVELARDSHKAASKLREEHGACTRHLYGRIWEEEILDVVSKNRESTCETSDQTVYSVVQKGNGTTVHFFCDGAKVTTSSDGRTDVSEPILEGNPKFSAFTKTERADLAKKEATLATFPEQRVTCPMNRRGQMCCNEGHEQVGICIGPERSWPPAYEAARKAMKSAKLELGYKKHEYMEKHNYVQTAESSTVEVQCYDGKRAECDAAE